MDYVCSAIQSILKIDFPDLQILVEDNSETNRLQTWIKENTTDVRLNYKYCSSPTSQAGNYDRAMRNVTGEYVALVGDDDGVSPEIIEAVLWAKQNKLDALTPVSVVNYTWPDVKMPDPNEVGPGKLRIRPFSSMVTYPNPKDEIIACINDYGQNFHRLPKAYFGIIRKECFDRVFDKCGSYFPGVSPDMASAISLANVVNRICHIDYPLFIPGTSAKSNAGQSGMLKHIGYLRNQFHLPPDCEEKWSEIVPKFYSVQTIWAETIVSSLRAMDCDDILKHINLMRLYSDCLILHPKFAFATLRNLPRAFRAINHSIIFGLCEVLLRYVYVKCRRMAGILARFLHIKKHIMQIPFYESTAELKNIEEAVNEFTWYMSHNIRPFREIVK